MVPFSTGCRRAALAGEATGVARPLRKWSSLPARQGRQVGDRLLLAGRQGWHKLTHQNCRKQWCPGCCHYCRCSVSMCGQCICACASSHSHSPEEARMRPRKRGEGFMGRDLNSGWNCRQEGSKKEEVNTWFGREGGEHRWCRSQRQTPGSRQPAPLQLRPVWARNKHVQLRRPPPRPQPTPCTALPNNPPRPPVLPQRRGARSAPQSPCACRCRPCPQSAAPQPQTGQPARG